MSMYSDVVYADGAFRTVECPVSLGDSAAYFDQAQRVAFPEEVRDGMFCRLAHGAGVSMVVAKAAHPAAGPLLVATTGDGGQSRILAPTTHGNVPAAIEYLPPVVIGSAKAFRITAVISTTQYQQWLCSPDLDEVLALDPVPLPSVALGSGDGILDIVEGVPTWIGRPHWQTLPEFPGLRWFMLLQRGQWVIGHVNHTPGHTAIPDQIWAGNRRSRNCYRLSPEGIAVPPRIAAAPDGVPYAAVSLRDGGTLVTFAHFDMVVQPQPIDPGAPSEPPPPPPPPPGEEPTMPDPDFLSEDEIFNALEHLRGQYPEGMTRDQCAELLNAIAYVYEADGVGLYRKTDSEVAGGRKYGRRHDGTPVSVDSLMVQSGGAVRMADVLTDAGIDEASAGKSTPIRFAWRELNAEHGETPDRFVAPILPMVGDVDPPPPNLPPIDPDGDYVQALLDALNRIEGHVERTDGRLDAIERALDELVDRPAPPPPPPPPPPPAAALPLPLHVKIEGNTTARRLFGAFRGTITAQPQE